MLLSSVILVLQEILAATLVVSVLAAFSVHHGLTRRWALPGLLVGAAGACLYASGVETVSPWFDYVGLDIINAGMQWAICAGLLILASLFAAYPRAPSLAPAYYLLMTTIVALVLTREGFEILLYAMNFVGDDDLWLPVMLGSLLGAGIGISAGTLLFYGIASLPEGIGGKLSLVLLSLFGGNMAAQGTLLLIQADWLPAGRPLWDMGSMIPESSLLGQLLSALVGYEATPTPLQAVAYAIQALTLLILFSCGKPSWRRRSGRS